MFGNLFNLSSTHWTAVLVFVNLFGTLIATHLMGSLAVNKTGILCSNKTNTAVVQFILCHF